MIRLALAALASLSVSAFAGLNPRPGTFPYGFAGQCTVFKDGNSQISDVKIAYGNSEELFRDGDVIFKVQYGNQPPDYGVFQLIVTNTKTKQDSFATVFVGAEFPRRIDLVSELGGISCVRQ